MKIYINNANENWVVDRFISEWNKYNVKQTKNLHFGKKIIWIIAPWAWKKIPKRQLLKNNVLCTIHHIDEDKFDNTEKNIFQERDEYVDMYHVISENTQKQVAKLTKKPIVKIPFWVNQNIWFNIENKKSIFTEFNLSNKKFYVGSFQRDTEGSDLISPKLSKGPDQFLEIVKFLHIEKENLEVILTGKRRNYLIKELDKANIPYKYFEMIPYDKINKLYNILDLYIVSSRYEGGPQSILECAITKTPIISTNVGIAPEILSDESLFNMNNFKEAEANVHQAFQNVQKYRIPKGFELFNLVFKELNEN
tara:strand:+ start:526 stop:1449 length:924 start_codon:yes stop_codon:yes gene_type:complete